MNLTAIVEKIDDLRYRAAIAQPFPLESEGASEEEALEHLRALAIAKLGSRKIVEICLPGEGSDNPWKRIAGMFKDHPDWDDYLRNIEEHRREMNTLELR